MKKTLLFFAITLSFIAAAQSKITVLEAGSRTPVSGATISCNKQFLAKTKADGTANFYTKCSKVDVSAPNYYEDEAVTDKVMEAVLTRKDATVNEIATVVMQDKSDPKALAILAKVNQNYKNNSPQSLDSYTFKSYEKISLDFDEDSVKAYNQYIEKRLDSVKSLPKNPNLDKEKIKDSVESVNVMKLMQTSKMFLWERASEFKFSKKLGEKITVLDNRVSGLKQPIYEMMALRSNRTQMPREIREENRSLYRFYLTDSIEIDGRKNFVIRFRQTDYKQPVQRRKFNGYLYIDAETFALKKIESNSKKKNEGSITSIWQPIDSKWFLVKENYKVKMGSTVFDDRKDKKNKETLDQRKKFGNYVYLNTDYFDFKTNTEVNPKDFSGYTMDVKNSDGSLLEKYRTDTLSARELQTYTKIDSVGKKYKLDSKINAITGLIRGKIRVGNVDFDAGQFIKYNQYEGFRAGIAAKLNERFNKWVSPDAYVAYGFKDRAFKYGAGVDLKTTLQKNSYFRAEYYHDVMAAGRFPENLWNFRMTLMNSGIDLKNDRFYQYDGFKVSYENDLTNALTLKISAKRDEEQAKFLYDYQNLGDKFTNFSTAFTLKFSPNSKNIMTPAGKYTYEQKFPELYLNVEQALKAFGGEQNYTRFNALFLHNFKTDIGVTGVRLYGGMLLGDAPIWHNYSMNGLSSGKDGINFNLTSYLGFATMEGGKYYNDKFIGGYFTHRIPWYFRTFGKKTSSFDVLYRAIIGDMKHPEFHNFEFQKLDHLYQEVGLEWNNFLSTSFNLGLFYRVGYYSSPNFKNNFALQFKFSALGF